jgi:hypothetical protein
MGAGVRACYGNADRRLCRGYYELAYRRPYRLLYVRLIGVYI